jgi:uncharacterized protein (AIM24 family)
MVCPRCHSQVADGIKFCGTCGAPMQASTNPNQGQTPPPSPGSYGAQPQSQGQGGYVPPNQYEEYANNVFGNAVPKAELHNPKGPIRIADMTVNIDGELVPVVDIMLGNQMPIYFEHHILLWKHPGVQIGFKSIQGAARRFFAGMQIFISEAQGPGNISFSRDSVGQIVALRLQPGQVVEVREHQFLVATSNVDYGFTFVQSASNILFSRTGLFIDQFTARGGEGLLLLHGYGNVFEKMLAPGGCGAWRVVVERSLGADDRDHGGGFTARRRYSGRHWRFPGGRLYRFEPLHWPWSRRHPIDDLSSTCCRGRSTGWRPAQYGYEYRQLRRPILKFVCL